MLIVIDFSIFRNTEWNSGLLEQKLPDAILSVHSVNQRPGISLRVQHALFFANSASRTFAMQQSHGFCSQEQQLGCVRPYCRYRQKMHLLQVR
jgi:hypothetical protein